MSDLTLNVMLGLVVAWPLLLAIPALHSRLPRPCYLALLPAAILLVLPGEASLAPSWVLFEAGLAINGESRWLLAMCVSVWVVAATATTPPQRDVARDHHTLFFLLTLAGNLGAVLAADLVSFFCATTLMGYGFFGMLMQSGDAAARRAGCIYLICLIIADLLLFEALLLAAFAAHDLQFSTLPQVMAGTAAAPTYWWIVCAGFMLKAGIWPVHLWLCASYRSAPQPAALLLGGVPVAMGLLGLVRWLPLGDVAIATLGTLFQILGVVAILYSVARFFTCKDLTLRLAWIIVAATGMFIMVLGTGLAYPDVWQPYSFLIYPFIAAFGVLASAMSVVIRRIDDRRQSTGVVSAQTDDFILRIMRSMDRMRESMTGKLSRLASAWHTVALNGIAGLRGMCQCQYLLLVAEKQLQRWPVAMTWFVLLATTVALLAFAY